MDQGITPAFRQAGSPPLIQNGGTFLVKNDDNAKLVYDRGENGET